MVSALTNRVQEATDGAFQALEISGQNLINVSTPGYKSARLYRDFRTNMQEVQRLTEPAKLTLTGNPRDISIEGPGFFVLRDRQGDKVLSRNLNISVDRQGRLSSEGMLLEPGIEVPQGVGKFEVGKDGTVRGQLPNQPAMVELGKLRLESYPAPGFLEFEGHLAYPTERAGPARELRPGATEMSQVRQGTQEGSNVELPRAISDFRDKNSQVSTLAQLLRLLNGSQRQFIQNISQSIG